MNESVIKEIKAETFNGIQYFKEELGIKTRVNPEKVVPKTLHQKEIDGKLLKDIKKARI
jgi:hypothetical protein